MPGFMLPSIIFNSYRTIQIDGAVQYYNSYGRCTPLNRQLPFCSMSSIDDDIYIGLQRYTTDKLDISANLSIPIYISPYMNSEQKSILTVFYRDDHFLFRFTGLVDFYVFSDCIHCVHLKDSYFELIEIWFKGVVLSFWLEQHGIPVLHASSVVLDDQAIAITGDSGFGKSSLTALFLKQGYPMLSDDVLPLQITDRCVMALPSSSFIKLWPDQLEYLFNEINSYPIFGTSKRIVPVGEGGVGTCCSKRMKLACIYVIDRVADSHATPKIRQIPQVEAVIELVNQSFLKRILAACNMKSKRLAVVADIAMRIPMKRIKIGEGWENRRKMMQLITEDAGK